MAEPAATLELDHSGDSDSTGSLTGQLLGTLWGVECIPQRWLDQVELGDVIEELARDLVAVAQESPEGAWRGYPGW